MKPMRPALTMGRAARVMAIAGLVAIGACTSGTPVPPLEQPIELKPGHRAHGRFAVREQDIYSIELLYPFDGQAQRSRAWTLAGGGKSPGAEATVRVTINEIRENGSRLLRHRDVPRPVLTSWGARALHAELTRLPLSPGLYTYDIRVLDASPQLREIPARVIVREAYRGK
ncbi:DUF5625 family protein [Lysobacter niastensis]|uniref:DUF5625 domain-containing protein n=1 Tax=Lysobacter niastensis TaxID=380629 RepID=A0ABS0B6L8_9GAMM|nr:DUF5625 family protein [Lysobacter niastensis]MBF6023307.1 hypothetical protein [Lysobacter niastensis]